MKKVIIAEKPSLAKNIKNSLGKIEKFADKRNGNGSLYFESGNYIITSGFGHLFTLCDVVDYGTDDTLPFIPRPFRFKLKQVFIDENLDKKEKELRRAANDGVAAQFNLIKELIFREDVDGIIHCGDADREGEVIVRLILQEAKNEKPVFRLWLPEQTEQTILKAVKELKNDSEYDNLYNEGLARMYIDWLYGINYSRYMKAKAGRSFNVGRVLVPIVEVIYKREQEIKNFKKQKYWQAEGKGSKNGTDFTVSTDKRFDSESLGTSYINILNSRNTYVQNIESKEVNLEPKKLFSLDTLQGFLAGKYEMTMDHSLAVLQTLYEAGYVTYPRTNTEYLAEAEKVKAAQIIALINKRNEEQALIMKDSKKIFDDTKIDSHSALTPTVKFPNMTELSSDQKKVYSAIYNRFCANFSAQPCIMNRKVITFENGDERFRISGDTVKNAGWMRFEARETTNDTEQLLPELSVGEKIQITFVLKECETKAPARYSVATLNKYLKAPFRKEIESADDTEEYTMLMAGLEIGTVGTRPGIIKNAQTNGYIMLKKNKFYCEPKGELLMSYLDQLKVNLYKEKSVEVSKVLKFVNQQKIPVSKAVAYAANELTKTIGLDVKVEKTETDPNKEVLGECPFCGRPVYDSEKVYYCSGRDKCGFYVFKKDKYFESMKKELTKSMMKKFLKREKVRLDLTSKEGKEYSVNISVNWSRKEYNGKLTTAANYEKTFVHKKKKKS